MDAHRRRGAPVVLTRSRAFVAALALVLVGGLAGAGSAALVYEWKGMTIRSETLDDGSTHLEIHRDGKKVLDEVFDPGEELMVTEDGGLIVVEPADGEGNGKSANGESANEKPEGGER